MDQLKVVMRANSYSTKALKIALELAKKYSAEVQLLDLSKTVLSLRDPSLPVTDFIVYHLHTESNGFR
jgi:hypothetical protein